MAVLISSRFPASNQHSQLGGLHKRYLEDENRSCIAPLPKELPVHLDSDSLSRSKVIPGPDIQWYPSYETYLARVAALAKLNLPRPDTVPAGFPTAVRHARAWSGVDYSDESKYALRLTIEEITEVERALAFCKGCSLIDIVMHQFHPIC